MKVKSLTVHNIGIIAHEEIVLNQPLNIFYGEIESGKTTLAITSIKLLFGGKFPESIIRKGESEGYVELVFDNARIKRSFYIDRSSITQARAIEYYLDNNKVSKPVDAIKKLLNPFLLDQDYLVNMSVIERKQYFIDLFDVDTSDLDEELSREIQNAKEIRSSIKNYGEIEIVPVEKPDIETLKKEKDEINNYNQTINSNYLLAQSNENKSVADYNNNVDEHNNIIDTCIKESSNLKNEIKNLEEKIDILKAKYDSNQKYLEDPENKKKEKKEPIQIERPVLKDSTEIDEKISNAKADEIRYQQYQAAILKQQEKEYHVNLLRESEANSARIKKEKTNKLSEISKNISIPGLVFDHNGTAIYNDTPMDMLSTSQIMSLSSECANLYPNELGIALQDKGESLGSSIFKYVDKAKENDLTILATVVSEKPAENIPDDVGVFIIKKGVIEK